MLPEPTILQKLTVIHEGTIITLMICEDTKPGRVEVHIGTDKEWIGRPILYEELLSLLLAHTNKLKESTVPA